MKLSCLLILMALSYFFNPIEPIVSKKPGVDFTFYDQPIESIPEDLDASLIEEQQGLHFS